MGWTKNGTLSNRAIVVWLQLQHQALVCHLEWMADKLANSELVATIYVLENSTLTPNPCARYATVAASVPPQQLRPALHLTECQIWPWGLRAGGGAGDGGAVGGPMQFGGLCCEGG